MGRRLNQSVEEEQAEDQGQGVDEIKQEEPREKHSKGKAPDNELRRSRRIKQRPRRNYSDMAFGNGPIPTAKHS